MSELTEVLEFSDPCDLICAAFAEAQKNFGKVRADQEGKVTGEKANYSYKYADLAGVLAATLPHLNAVGIGFLQPFTVKGVLVTVETRLVLGAQWIRSKVTLESSGSAAQKIGSASTYAKRYAAQSLLAVASEDDDGKSGSTRDESDDRIAELQRELAANQKLAEDRHRGTAMIVKKLIARGVPAAWQTLTAGEISASETKVWPELSYPQLVAFSKAIDAAFPPQKAPQDDAKPPDAQEPAPPTETPADVDTDPVVRDPEEDKRQATMAFIETKLRDLRESVSDDDLQTLTASIRASTMAAKPDDETIGMTYDWRSLTESEMRDFWKQVPKKARAPRETVPA